MTDSNGPLAGVSIVEFAGLGPAPFAAMLLGGLGAEIIRIDRPVGLADSDSMAAYRYDVTNRDRRSIALDLKHPKGLEVAARLLRGADGLIEGFRPGVMERLGLGPSNVLDINPGITYVRMTGWGQEGPLSKTAGHDINYIALSGLLESIGSVDSPSIPLNILGDYGGGATMAAIGMLSGILKSRLSGVGSVVDAAIVDGTALLGALFHGMVSQGTWDVKRASNLLDGGAPFYSLYRCKDGMFISVGALEPKFYSELLLGLGLTDHPAFATQYDRSSWGEMRRVLTDVFSKEDSEHFDRIFDGSDACFARLESLLSAKENAHMSARKVFEEIEGVMHPRPAPRFDSFTPIISRPPFPGEHRNEILESIGISAQEVGALESSGVFG